MRIQSGFSLLSCVILVVLTSCSHSTPVASSGNPSPRYPMIVRLKSRHYSITISAAPRGPVYSVANSGGEMLVENLSLDALHTAHPDLYSLVAPALAPSASATVSRATAPLYAGVE
jgi:hypothetical protein